jgi:hypothetical protein
MANEIKAQDIMFFVILPAPPIDTIGPRSHQPGDGPRAARDRVQRSPMPSTGPTTATWEEDNLFPKRMLGSNLAGNRFVSTNAYFPPYHLQKAKSGFKVLAPTPRPLSFGNLFFHGCPRFQSSYFLPSLKEGTHHFSCQVWVS